MTSEETYSLQRNKQSLSLRHKAFELVRNSKQNDFLTKIVQAIAKDSKHRKLSEHSRLSASIYGTDEMHFASHQKTYLLFLLEMCFSFIFIRKQLFCTIFIFILLTQIFSTQAYVLQHEGESQSFLYKRLVGRQRREAQREILSILGLNHRPRIHNPKSMETSSAPLYMLGLYTSASHLRGRDLTEIDPLNSREDGRQARPAHSNLGGNSATDFSLGSDEIIFPFRVATDLNQYIRDNGILTNEIGVFEPVAGQIHMLSNFGVQSRHNSYATVDTERRLLDKSDLVISFINTRQQQALDDFGSFPSELRSVLRRHRSFHFDVSQTSSEDRLRVARFRLYKERSDLALGNQTLRVNVYQTSSRSERSSTLYLLGSRLVDSMQEGWLVYDVASVLHEWILHPERNLGLKVTVETLEGRSLKPTKTGLVGRRGSPAKQAFIVAFFNQVKPELLHPNIRRRIRRNAGLETNNEDPTEDSQSIDVTEEENLNSEETNGTNQNGNPDYVSDDGDLDEDDESLGGSQKSAQEENDARGMSKRKTKPKKPRKGRRKKRPPKNSSKRKPIAEHCQRKQFYVDFKDLGWHTWIIAPKAYKAYHCSGKCSFPLNAGLNATNHAIVQSLVHVRLPDLNIPEPCCSPSKLEPLDILFFNDQTKVIYKKYQDMVVSSCGCH